MIDEVHATLAVEDGDHPAAERNLMLYDPQARSVHNNRRHYPALSG